MNCIEGGVKGVQSHGKGNIHSVFDMCFTNLIKLLKIALRTSLLSMNDGHAIVCPPVLGLLKSHLRCCEPHLSHHSTVEFVDFHFHFSKHNTKSHIAYSS